MLRLNLMKVIIICIVMNKVKKVGGGDLAILFHFFVAHC